MNPLGDIEAVVAKIVARTDTNARGCWVWQGARSSGYGVIRVNMKLYRAHRITCAHRFFGSLKRLDETGLHVLHRCDNPACVNPDHLWLGTDWDNSQDRVSKGRSDVPKGEDHYRAKLGEAQVREIRTRHASGKVLLRVLAAEYGVSERAITKILRRETWKHLKKTRQH